MSVTMCVFCDESVDTDYHEQCPSCERCPFGENMSCYTCESFVEDTTGKLRVTIKGHCTNLLSVKSDVDDSDDACDHYTDVDYNFPKENV